MDEQQIFNIVSKCKHLKYNFSGIYAADNFPVDFSKNTFIIVNTSNSDSVGEHWILLAKQNSDEAIYYADPFGFPTETYKNLYKRIKYYACVNVMTPISLLCRTATSCLPKKVATIPASSKASRRAPIGPLTDKLQSMEVTRLTASSMLVRGF